MFFRHSVVVIMTIKQLACNSIIALVSLLIDYFPV